MNANGLTLYDKSLSINGMKIASGTTNASLEITSDNHLLVHAFSIDSLNVYTMGLSKLDTAANTLWSRFYPYPSSSTHSIDVKECSDNNYIMLGYRDTLISGNALMTYVVKVDTAGNKLWENNYYLSSFTWPNSIKELRNGNFLVLGSHEASFHCSRFDLVLNTRNKKLESIKKGIF